MSLAGPPLYLKRMHDRPQVIGPADGLIPATLPTPRPR